MRMGTCLISPTTSKGWPLTLTASFGALRHIFVPFLHFCSRFGCSNFCCCIPIGTLHFAARSGRNFSTMLFSRGAVATAVLRRNLRPSASSVASSSAAAECLVFGGLDGGSRHRQTNSRSQSASSFSTTAPTLQAHSFDEPNPSLFQSDRFAGAALDADKTADDLVADIAAADLDVLLRSDVRTMGSLLGNIIHERNGKNIFDKVEKLRNLAKVRVHLFGCGDLAILVRVFYLTTIIFSTIALLYC